MVIGSLGTKHKASIRKQKKSAGYVLKEIDQIVKAFGNKVRLG
jgi:hypothetical protein